MAEAPAPGLADLERQWHRCVRQAFSGQPSTIAKPAAERAALAACKAQEDAYVAAVMAARTAEPERRPGLVARARAWVASATAYVFDPFAAWLGTGTR